MEMIACPRGTFSQLCDAQHGELHKLSTKALCTPAPHPLAVQCSTPAPDVMASPDCWLRFFWDLLQLLQVIQTALRRSALARCQTRCLYTVGH